MTFFIRVLVALSLLAAPAQALETAARAAMVVDYDTGTVLLAKNADAPLPPASMSKLMTLNMVFEALEAGRITLDEKFSVSASAVAVRGSSMFLNTQDRVTVDDLIKGVIVLSGNDAAVVLAEGLARYEEMVTAPVTRLQTSWAGLRSFAPDNTLVVGPDKAVPSFFWLAGQGGYGFQTAPAASRLVADLVLGRRPELEAGVVQALSAQRF